MKTKSPIGLILQLFMASFMWTPLGCAEGGPVTPLSVTPIVRDADVPSSLDFFSAPEGAQFVATAIERTKPGALSSETRTQLEALPPRGSTNFTRVTFERANKTLFVLEREGAREGIVLPVSAAHHVIPPVEWVQRVATLGFADPTAAHAWYVAMSERLGTAGRASGIVVFDNGNAMGVVVDLRPFDDGDVELVAQSKFFHKGEYNPAEWGPRVDGAQTFSATKMNGHLGVSIRDLLRREAQSTPIAPQRTPTPPPAVTGSTQL